MASYDDAVCNGHCPSCHRLLCMLRPVPIRRVNCDDGPKAVSPSTALMSCTQIVCNQSTRSGFALVKADNRADTLSVHWQESLGLDGTQIRLAQKVWRDASQALSKLKSDRTDILSRMNPSAANPLAHHLHAPQSTSRTCTLLQQVAELTENAQLQLEVARNASRKLVWQVCSPENLIRLTCFYWPVFPDLMHTLQAVGTP